MRERHPSEDDLILRHGGEAPDSAPTDEHLENCETCRAAFRRIGTTLGLVANALPVPERGDEYGDEVWNALAPRLSPPPAPARAFDGWRWALAAGVAALVVAVFLAGRYVTPGTASRPTPAPLAQGVRERILLVAVGDHLERSEMVLLEFVNSGSHGREPARESRLAEELVGANRLYRQTASRSGDPGVASVLDELERVLLEIAHAPTPAAREALRGRIESEGTLFKIRVIQTQVRQRERGGDAARPLPGGERES